MSLTQRIKADFVALAREYAGKWVALHPDTGEVIAAGNSAVEVLEAAHRSGVEDPLVTRVVDDYSIYVPCAIA